MPKETHLTVDCGDTEFYFRYGRRMKLSVVEDIFDQRIAAWRSQLFPGLRFKDDQGRMWMPELRVELVPTKENSNG